MTKAISIVGFSGSGKTELICRLLKYFSGRGLRVAVLKHTHHKLSPEDEGKDTWRFRQAGAAVTALAAPGLLQISFPGEPPLAESLTVLSPETDLILVEGYKYGPLPKIVVLNPELKESPPDLTQVMAVVSPVSVASPGPVFRPEEVEAIGALILDHLGLSGML
jgi:molybdopterin-guanine dinucleotide biosynthesis protein B